MIRNEIQGRGKTDREAMHCIGNGRVIAYGRGGDVVQMFGDDYSTPNFLTIRTEGDWEAVRVPAAGIFDYRREGRTGFRDFVEGRRFVRRVRSESAIRFVMECSADPECIVFDVPGIENAYVCQLGAGAAVYEIPGLGKKYVLSKPYYMLLRVIGGRVKRTGKRMEAELADGEILCTFSDRFEECLSATEEFETETSERAAFEFWRSFFEACPKLLGGEFEDTAVGIKAQLSELGPEIAGYPYHLAYVRDNYGTFRGMLALGMFGEAERLVRYFAGILEKFGEIHNAQGMGQDLFHIHEHDESEITAYVGLMPFDLAAAAGSSVSKEFVPLVSWCAETQLAALVRGMLPFNGDETYIAGGILPRSVIEDGSLESTMLFHTFLSRVLASGCVSKPLLERCCRAKGEIESHFEENFVEGGTLFCNNPARRELAPRRFFRHGVAECMHRFGLTFGNAAGRFVCEECFGKFSEETRERFRMPSIAMMQEFVGGTLIGEQFRGDEVACAETQTVVGYEFALFAISFAARGRMREAEAFAETARTFRDRFGMWSEYVSGSTASGTRCRAWESGINVCALDLVQKGS